MDLLENNKKKKGKTQAQKIILILLVISIILSIIVGIAIVLVSMKKDDALYTISINNKSFNATDLQLLTLEDNVDYISLKNIANKLGYEYYNGEFKTTEENKNKGYIYNGNNVVQFFADENNIYKSEEQSVTDYEYYVLDNKILLYQNNLYIALDDLDVALNLILKYSSKNKVIQITTPEYWISSNKEILARDEITISDSQNNIKALSYGYVIISKNNKYGVISLNGDELIGTKYGSIEFIEYTKEFKTSNSSNEFGIISIDGMSRVNLQYDSIDIMNYNPLLYKVKYMQKYGIIKSDGTLITNELYDSIGYPQNKEKEINYTLIVPNINENIPESIIVCANGKYGLINAETGETVLACSLNGIYSATKDDVVYYIVETQERKFYLDDYITELNRVTVKLN